MPEEVKKKKKSTSSNSKKKSTSSKKKQTNSGSKKKSIGNKKKQKNVNKTKPIKKLSKKGKLLSPKTDEEYKGDKVMNLLYTKAKDPTYAVMGVDTEGKVFATSLAAGPHWLCCGQTGSGKSVFVNAMLASLMYHSSPDELILTMIDPKKVEFATYKDLPHVAVDPVTDMGDAYGLLAYWTWEMDHRYEILEAVGVKNIAEYNEWAIDHEEQAIEYGYKRMKYVICVIDEYADMTMQDKTKANEGLIVRLAQKARACGIVLIIATQRPSVDVISPIIKSNVPARIGLKTADANNSNIIIGTDDLEKLLGYGDAWIKLTDGTMKRVQGPYLSNEELEAIFNYLKEHYPAPEKINFKQHCVDHGLAKWAENYDDDVPEKDRHVTQMGRGSMF